MEAVKNMTWLESTEPRFTALFFNVIAFCITPRTFDELNAEILSYPEMATPVQSVQTVLEWLEECGALEASAYEGQPRLWHTTAEGREYLKLRDSKLEKVNRENEKLVAELLAFCRTGRRLDELERAFPAKGNEPKISYYILELERAGALEWRDGWTTSRSAN